MQRSVLLIAVAACVSFASATSAADDSAVSKIGKATNTDASNDLPQKGANSATGTRLEGHAEELYEPIRIERPGKLLSDPALQGNVSRDSASLQSSVVNSLDFSSAVQRPRLQPVPNNQLNATGNAPISGSTLGGQDEYWVNWNAWRNRVCDAVWDPIKAQRIVMWGRTRVDYDVSRDHHIRVTSVRTPDPTGASGRILADSIMALDGSPILEFPNGSRQAIHHSYNASLGLPLPARLSRKVYLPGGTEHVLEQW
jgi:hypothetical protein